jgi:hypothetical protein
VTEKRRALLGAEARARAADEMAMHQSPRRCEVRHLATRCAPRLALSQSATVLTKCLAVAETGA